MPETDPARQFLRHTLATLAYRSGKAMRDAPASFAEFRLGEGTRTPLHIVAHMGDLFDWAGHLVEGRHVWKQHDPGTWNDEVTRFFAAVERLDGFLASDARLQCTVEELFQGPIADALIHTGQLALMRRRAGAPIRGENYFKADIATGRVGLEQAPARVEFD